jgi:hypothetical protein
MKCSCQDKHLVPLLFAHTTHLPVSHVRCKAAQTDLDLTFCCAGIVTLAGQLVLMAADQKHLDHHDMKLMSSLLTSFRHPETPSKLRNQNF